MFQADQTAVLERVAAGHPLNEILEDIVRMIERQAEGMQCSLLLLDDDRVTIRHGAAPSLPRDYAKHLDGLPIGPTAGSCGAAAYRRERVIVEDIATHPNWTIYRHLALPFGLRACWSSPVFSAEREVLGTFAMYYRTPRAPTDVEIQWVDAATHLAAIAIVSDRAIRSLRRSEAAAQRLARLYAMSSAINEAIVRERDIARLYDVACRIAVDHGMARLAWIGLVDDAGAITPVGHAGSGYERVGRIHAGITGDAMRDDPVTRAIRLREPTVCNDLANAPAVAWKHVAGAEGLRSVAAFPMRSGASTGVLVIYAGEIGAFGAEETNVLTALASDIAFAVDSARTATALRQTEAQRALVFDSVTDVIFYLSVEPGEQYRFRSINRAFTETTGVREQDIVGRLVDDVIPPTSLPLVKAKYAEAIAARAKVSWEEVSRYPSGLKYGEVTVSPIFDGDGRCTHLVGSVHDVTERREAEQERARFETQLHQAQRLQALGTLSGGIAHDFNNILTAIHCNLELAVSSLDDDPGDARESLAAVRKAAERATSLVRQVLTFSRRSEPRTEVVDLGAIIAEATELLRAGITSRATLRTQVAPGTPRIAGDPTQIHQVIMNLVSNAVHAVGDTAGVVEVIADACDMSPGSRADAPDLAAGHYARLVVRDDGTGMDAATLRRIFEPFFTTKRPGVGTGLGLSVVHGIVKSHHGAISVHSELGKGTTFELLFPAAVPAPAVVAPPAALRRRQRVLFIDDDDGLVLLARRAFSRLGHDVTAYASSLDALEDFRHRATDFDVVVTDIGMPGLDGATLIREVLRIRPGMRIVVTSGCFTPEDAATITDLGVAELYDKPLSIDDLAKLVELRATG